MLKDVKNATILLKKTISIYLRIPIEDILISSIVLGVLFQN